VQEHPVFRRSLAALAFAAGLPPGLMAHPHPGDDEPLVPAHAATAPALTRAFDAAWRRSVEAVLATGRLTRAEAEREAAERWLAGAPSLELDHRRGTGSFAGGLRESEASLVFPMQWAGQRGARSAAAAAHIEWSEAALHAARWRLGGEVRESAWAVAIAHAEEAALRSHAESLGTLHADVERRVAAGDLARSDALAARAEWLAALSAATEARARREAAESRWTLLAGIPAPHDPSEPDAMASLEHPAVELARRVRERAERQRDQARALRRDPLELALRMRTERAAPELPSQNAVGLGVRIPLGDTPSQGPKDAAAAAELDAARAEEEAAIRRVKSEIEAAERGLTTARERVETERTRLALLREREALLDKSFRMGETALPELLRARSSHAQGEAAVARQTAEAGLARARLLQARGRLP
jgi:cobalt-zinc-cadmium efflux system outer membrane protein